MDFYINAILYKLMVANESIFELISFLPDDILDERLLEDRRSTRELLSHISVLYKADFLILNGASKEEMEEFYKNNHPFTLNEVKQQLQDNFQFLVDQVSSWDSEELSKLATSWWGVTSSKFEWLIQIVSHIYHHRGQLHTMMVSLGIKIDIALFE